MSSPNVTQRVRRQSSEPWQCDVVFTSHIPSLTEDAMTRYLPVASMAHLPSGGLACVLVACRVEDVQLLRRFMKVELRVASSLWSDVVETWVRTTLTVSVARAFTDAAVTGLPPKDGSEVEIVAYYAKGVEETMESFAKYLGVSASVHFEYLAGVRRVQEGAERRANREAARRAAKEAEDAKKWWNRLFDWLLPKAPSDRTLPLPPLVMVQKDTWAESAETFQSTVLAACEQPMGSLLRRVTIRDPAVAHYLLGKEGVAAGDSATMMHDRDKLMQVTRVHSGVHATKSVIFDVARLAELDDDMDVPSAGHAVAKPSLYEARFTPSKK